MPSSCLLPRFFLSLMCCGHQIDSRMPKKSSGLQPFSPLVLLSMMENSASNKPLLILTFRTQSHSARTYPFPHSLYPTLLIFLREAFAHFCAITGTVSVNTPQEFTLASPASPGPAQLKLGRETDVSPACTVPNRPNTYQPLLISEDSGTQAHGPLPRFAKQTSLC